MSHIVTVKTKIRDPDGLRRACRRNQLDDPVFGTAELFMSKATGYQVQLPQWRYAVVCDTDNGVVQFDNFGGRWGEQSHLDRLLQSYAIEQTKLEARRQGHSVTEQSLDDGSVKLVVQVVGVA